MFGPDGQNVSLRLRFIYPSAARGSPRMEGFRRVIMPRPLRQRAIEEWRGLPEAEPKQDRTLSVREVLVQLAPKLGLEARLREEEVIAAWGEIVGDFFAKHSRPIRLHQGVLLVNVLQPTVLYELDRQWKSLILTKLKKRFGGKLIRELRFRVG